MQVYLVGGAVRDQLLGLPVKERDWVVVGATVEQMLAAGYQAVGKDFPVFLHPKTHEEYALARTERKNGRGYTGFVFYTSPDVTLEEDLRRRDLTINAMAQDEKGKIIDPFDGQADLKAKLLRHVSDAFIEDPVRLLRIARFAAKLAPLGFSVAKDTLQFLRTMVANGEVDALVKERVWQELQRALQEPATDAFFAVLNDCGALNKLFPEIKLATSLTIANIAIKPNIKFAILFKDNPEGLKLFYQRYVIPKDYFELANLVNQFYSEIRRAYELNAEQIITLLEKTDAWRRPERFQSLLEACEIIDKTKSNFTDYLTRLAKLTKTISVQPFLDQGLSGIELAGALRKARIAAIENQQTLNKGN